MKRQQRTIGSIVKVPLEEGYHTYARILETRLAFYDARTKEELDVETIVDKAVLFIVIVENYPINQGIWLKVGQKLPLEENLTTLKPLYIEDYFSGKHYIVKGTERAEVSKEEIGGLESFTHWNCEGIEKRLNDHYANRKNEFVADMKEGRQTSGMVARALRRKKELAEQQKQKKP